MPTASDGLSGIGPWIMTKVEPCGRCAVQVCGLRDHAMRRESNPSHVQAAIWAVYRFASLASVNLDTDSIELNCRNFTENK